METAKTTIKLSKGTRDQLKEIMASVPGVHSLGAAVEWAVDSAVRDLAKKGGPQLGDKFNW